MAAEPSQDDISTFTSFTQAPYSIAVQYLKQFNGNDNQWDENAFHSDKAQYGPENRPHKSFEVHSEDTLSPNVFMDGAPSRPPSRVSNTGSTIANKGVSDDEQMIQAFPASMGQNYGGQESGVIDASEKHFGPAYREYYDNNAWAMTIPSRSQEYSPNPDPENRKRTPGTPAMMRPTPDGHYLPSAFTILHAIPMAKEALLVRDYLLNDYGRNSDWWQGDPIQMPKTVSVDESLEDIEIQGLVWDCQRIMAFLELTERAYCSLDVFGEGLPHIMKHTSQDPGDAKPEGHCLDKWRSAVLKLTPDYHFADVFKISCTQGNAGGYNEFSYVSLEVQPGGDLYDAMDFALWGSLNQSDPEDPFLEFGEVVLMRLTLDHNSGLGVGSGIGRDIPAIWYTDRYLESSVAAARDMREQKAELLKEIARVEEKQLKLTRLQDPTNAGRFIDTSQLQEATNAFFSAAPENLPSNTDEVSMDQGMMDFSRIQAELKRVAERVAQKFKTLEESKEQALQKMRELSRLYTEPSDNADEPPTNRFTLRGISTNPTTTYVLANPNTSEDLLDTEVADWQWWRIEYSSGEAKPVSNTKVTEDKVLEAAKHESQKIMVVYASDEAVSYQTDKLPDVLRNFVRADNLAFAEELEGPPPLSPAQVKRKADESSAVDVDGTNWGGYKSISPPPRERDPENGKPLLQEPKPAVAADAVVKPSSDLAPQPPPHSYGKPALPPPTPPRSARSRRAGYAPYSRSGDERVPTSEHIERVGTSNGYHDVDLLGDDGVEMQERSGGFGVVPGGSGPGVGESATGSGYPVEIRMPDVEEMELEDDRAKAAG